ncbi:phosphopantetheine-binding protein [Streptomyces sp. NPDC048002]|uniref:acyl carrier protein n=1 Tax=Streptomyces sp. NPDC048002 TaxID=3154344 RepID=UPI0033D5D4E3
MSTTYERLADIVGRLHDVPAERIRPEATFGELDVDSLTMVEISIRIERDLGVVVPDSELEPDLTLAQAVELIEAKQPA